MAKSGILELGDNIYGQYRSIFNHCTEIEIGEKTHNKGCYAVKGHSRSSKVIKVGTNRKPVFNFLLVINNNWHPISYRFGDIAFLSHPLGLRDNARCSSWAHWKARSGLDISDNWTFLASCYGWGATRENRSKIGDFATTRLGWPKISGRRVRSQPIILAWIVRPMNALKRCRWQFAHELIFVADFFLSEVRF